jgi:protein SCO1
MKALRMKGITWSAVAVVAAAGGLPHTGMSSAYAHGGAPHTTSASEAPATPAVSRNPWGANYFPNVELTTQHGKTVRFYDDLLKGKTVGINLIFTDCTEVCPLETANMVQLQRELGARAGKDIVFYSISIDPKNDTPAVLKAYAEKFGANWLFLTGKPDDIKLIAQKLGMSRTTSSTHHAAQLMIGNEPTGQWTRTSAVDNPRFLAGRIGSLLGWRDVEPQKSYAEARPVMADSGQRMFQSRCSSCHTIGQGDRVGPDLLGVTTRRDRTWLTRYVLAPDEVLAAGDPIATALFDKYKKVRMPNLRLSNSEAADIVSYLEQRSSSAVRDKAQASAQQVR